MDNIVFLMWELSIPQDMIAIQRKENEKKILDEKENCNQCVFVKKKNQNKG